MKDIVGNGINIGDVCMVTDQRSSSLNILVITSVKPGSIKGRNLKWSTSWDEGKRSSSGVVRLSDQQKAELFKNNQGYKLRYTKVLTDNNIKLN